MKCHLLLETDVQFSSATRTEMTSSGGGGEGGGEEKWGRGMGNLHELKQRNCAAMPIKCPLHTVCFKLRIVFISVCRRVFKKASPNGKVRPHNSSMALDQIMWNNSSCYHLQIIPFMHMCIYCLLLSNQKSECG